MHVYKNGANPTFSNGWAGRAFTKGKDNSARPLEISESSRLTFTTRKSYT